MKDNITERINEIMQFFKMKKSDFSKKIGLDNYSTIARIAAGEYKPSYEVLNRIVNSFPEINPSWLLTGEGEMLNDQTMIQEPKFEYHKLIAEKEKIIEWLNRELIDKREMIRHLQNVNNHLIEETNKNREEVNRLKSELDMLKEELKKKEVIIRERV
jgi:peptidoglycan hydrolase CwlO-like protein